MTSKTTRLISPQLQTIMDYIGILPEERWREEGGERGRTERGEGKGGEGGEGDGGEREWLNNSTYRFPQISNEAPAYDIKPSGVAVLNFYKLMRNLRYWTIDETSVE
jgi:hypothetical protein